MSYSDDKDRTDITTPPSVIWMVFSKICRYISESLQDTAAFIDEFISSYTSDKNYSVQADALIKKRLRWQNYQVKINKHDQYKIPAGQTSARNYLFSRRMMKHNPRDKKEKQQLCSLS